jgi:hypothetical protein
MERYQHNSTFKASKPMNKTGKVLRELIDAGKLAYGSTLRKPRKRMARESDKRKAERPAYRQAKAEAFEASGGKCVWPGCNKDAVDPHHAKKASRSRKDRCNSKNIFPLCREHHDRTESHPAEATELGMLISGRQFVTPSPNGTPWTESRTGKDSTMSLVTHEDPPAASLPVEPANPQEKVETWTPEAPQMPPGFADQDPDGLS